MRNYAKLNSSNKVIKIVKSFSELQEEDVVLLDSYDLSVLGKIYDKTANKFFDPLVSRISLYIVTTSEVVNNRIMLAKGETISITAKLKDLEDNVLPLDCTLALPVKQLGGPIVRTIGITFINGEAAKDIVWPSSGEFEITEDILNENLSSDKYYKLNRLVFSVYE